MYQEAQSITDAARIEELVKQMNFYSLEHVWYIGMPETLRCAVWQKWLKNYDGICLHPVDIHMHTWIDQDLKRAMGY